VYPLGDLFYKTEGVWELQFESPIKIWVDSLKGFSSLLLILDFSAGWLGFNMIQVIASVSD